MVDKITIINKTTILNRLKQYFRKGLITTTAFATIYGGYWFIPRAWNQYKLDKEIDELYLTYDIGGSSFGENNVIAVFEKLDELGKKDYFNRAPFEEKKEEIVKECQEKFQELVSILRVTTRKGLFRENEIKFCEELAKCRVITEEAKNDFFEGIKRREEMTNEAELANNPEKSEVSLSNVERIIKEKREEYERIFSDMKRTVDSYFSLSYSGDVVRNLEVCENLAQNKFITEEELNEVREFVKPFFYDQVNEDLKENNPASKLSSLKSAMNFSKRTGIVYAGLEKELVEAYIAGSFYYDYFSSTSKIIDKLEQIILACESADKPVTVSQNTISRFFETFNFEVYHCTLQVDLKDASSFKDIFAKAETVISYFELPEKECKLKDIALKCFNNIENDITFLPDSHKNVLELFSSLEYFDEHYDLKKRDELKHLLCSMIENSNSAEVLHKLFFYALEKSGNMEDEQERESFRLRIANACLSSDGSKVCSEQALECLDYTRSIYLAYGFVQNQSRVRTVDFVIDAVKSNKKIHLIIDPAFW
ncbi:hypothetical protein HZA97_02565 [Candidatus Woesearchaeota archaeon]|nr:hypothetical protein [Candidatus Woesearchaeota archaeon]